MIDYEKLGIFYLGKEYNIKEKKILDNFILYDSKDLVTHALCVGMTGSGKTGLCICLLEEAAIDKIPAVIIDPKGDMVNLLLTFPELTPNDFKPWLTEEEATKKGLTLDQLAVEKASNWEKGIISWHQNKERINRLRNSVEFEIYTPGSKAGKQVSILGSLDLPNEKVLSDDFLLRESITSIVTAILSLVGIEADPIKSKETILISSVIEYCWKSGKGLDLESLIQMIQKPPLKKIGVFDLETFYPSKERFELAMLINNLVASPGFSNWLIGEPLKFQNFLYTHEGKPKHSIFSIAHLNDQERMFFVTLLLNESINWMRAQTGTSSLRAILYMDEIYGYFPPVANPPSKVPMMTLLKQARAFGLGVMLATQNPVDLDYKGLSNIGTWFIGRLQTIQDKKRLLDGLQSLASSTGKSFDLDEIDDIISSLENRIFLMNNVHDDYPVIFHTRWAMSFLSGPLTRVQISELMKNKISINEEKQDKVSTIFTESSSTIKPLLPDEIKQFFVPIRSLKPSPNHKLLYKPFLFGNANVTISSAKYKVEKTIDVNKFFPLEEKIEAVNWDNPVELDISLNEFLTTEEGEAEFGSLPKEATQSKQYNLWQKDFQNLLYRSIKLKILYNLQLKEYSQPDESEQDFKIRISHKIRELRDNEISKLKEKYSLKFYTLEEKLRRKEQQLQTQAEQAKQEKLQTAISLGSTILGAILGRKTISTTTIGRAGTTLRRGSRILKEAKDVELVKESIENLQDQINALENQMNQEIELLSQKYSLENIETQEISLNPTKTGIDVRTLALVWLPYWKEGETITLAC